MGKCRLPIAELGNGPLGNPRLVPIRNRERALPLRTLRTLREKVPFWFGFCFRPDSESGLETVRVGVSSV
jgi:hypothetical protein